MKRLLLVATIACPALLTAASAPRIGAGARIHAPELGPGWHRGFFNQLRTEPSCYLVVIFAPRSSPEEPLRVLVTVPASRIRRLQITSVPGSSMQEWDGLSRSELPEEAWREVELAPLLPKAGRCNFEDPLP